MNFIWNKIVNSNKKNSSKDLVKNIYESVKKNIDYVKDELGNSQDLVTRIFQIGKSPFINIGVVYLDGMADNSIVNDFIMKSLMIEMDKASPSYNKESIFYFVQKHALTISDLQIEKDFNQIIPSILSGNTVIFIQGCKETIVCSTKGYETRGVTESSTQVVVRGPKEAFNEDLKVNTSLVRRRIQDPKLRVDSLKVGKRTQTLLSIMYVEDIANEKIVEEVKRRIKKVKTDSILDSGMLEEYIQDETKTFFPTVYNTERPDIVAANLLEGRVAIFVNGSPFVLTVPVSINQFFQSAEDYYQRADIGTALRLLRYFVFLISIFAPSLYIAAITYHQEMIPTELLINLASQREGMPFPAFVEALMMEITFEILREAGIRMPRAVGSAISIVGALVLGEAAVNAGLVSPAMIIIVSITAISSFATPSFNLAIAARLVRFPLMILAATLGVYGIAMGTMLMIGHLASIRSFGIPYLAPFAPTNLADQKDALVRFPLWSMLLRPKLISNKNKKREQENLNEK